MRPAPTICPICQSNLEVTRLHCTSCDTSLEGRFEMGHFSNLSPDQMEFIFTFIRCEGKINRVEQELNLPRQRPFMVDSRGTVPDEGRSLGADSRPESPNLSAAVQRHGPSQVAGRPQVPRPRIPARKRGRASRDDPAVGERVRRKTALLASR